MARCLCTRVKVKLKENNEQRLLVDRRRYNIESSFVRLSLRVVIRLFGELFSFIIYNRVSGDELIIHENRS